MKSSTIRAMVIGITTLLVIVMGVQLYWLNKTYRLEENEFNRKVNSALHTMMRSLRFHNEDTSSFAGGIGQPLPSFFEVRTKYDVDSEILAFQLKKEIEEFNIFTSYKFGIYNSALDTMRDVQYISYNKQADKFTAIPMPVLKRPYNYIGVYFPHRESYLIRGMSFWIFSTVLLLLVIIGFGISLFKLFKQRQLSEIQKEFINNMTHEFRTPVSTIQISTEVLKDHPDIQSNRRLFQYTDIIEKEANHLEGQVDRVLQVAKMEDHRISLENKPVNIHKVLKDAISSFGDKIKIKGGRFLLFPKADKPVILADRLHFVNIIFNLIDNAIKYVDRPGIELGTYDFKKGIKVYVKDNGKGIPEKYQKFLFTKFFRVPTGNLHEVKGFGLGLSYVKTYTTMLGGHIKMESNPSKGTIFTLYFPYSEPAKKES